ncbi:hypothetical protein F2P79_007038 [Pimephales promelas]|nr:hypothetical protein F2P79_007038 [Pimephales promelas]
MSVRKQTGRANAADEKVSHRSRCPFSQQMGDTGSESEEEKQEMKTGKIYIRTPLLGFSIIATATGCLATGYTMAR